MVAWSQGGPGSALTRAITCHLIQEMPHGSRPRICRRPVTSSLRLLLLVGSLLLSSAACNGGGPGPHARYPDGGEPADGSSLPDLDAGGVGDLSDLSARLDPDLGPDRDASTDGGAGSDALPRSDLGGDAGSVRDSGGEELEDQGREPDLGEEAPPWSPAPLGHPRLYFGPEEAEAVRARALSQREPFVTLVSRLRSAARGAMRGPEDPEHHDPYAAAHNGLLAKVAAAVAFVDREGEAVSLARQVLEGFQDDPRTLRIHQFDKATIKTGMALSDLAVAYDLMVGAGLLHEAERQAAADRLARLALNLEETYRGRLNWFVATARNNHVIKLASGLGMAGLVLPEHPGSGRWVAYAQTELDDLLFGVQYAGEGGFAEGPSYYRYAAVSHLPFLWAYHHLHPDQRHRFSVDCGMRHPDCQEREVVLGDQILRQELAEIHRWILAVSLPSGMSPNIDDSRNVAFFGGITAALHQDPALLWHWDHTWPARWDSGGAAMALETLVIYNEELASTRPDLPLVDVRARAGTAVLRSQWGADATYLLLLGEHGPARQAGMAHEHLDASSFSIFAHREYLLLDTGYPGYMDRFLTANPVDHNLVLVDGEGPPQGLLLDPGVDAFLGQGFDHGDLAGVTVETAYRGVHVQREIRMLDRRFLVVATGLDAQGPHLYTHLLHGNAGGDTGQPFELREGGASWTRPGASLVARVLSTRDEPDQLASENEHVTMGVQGLHAVLESRVESEDLAFLALLLPIAHREPEPRVEVFVPGPARVAALLFDPQAREGDAPSWILVAAEPGAREQPIALPDGRTIPCEGLLTARAFP